jgi:hypothetical protein
VTGYFFDAMVTYCNLKKRKGGRIIFYLNRKGKGDCFTNKIKGVEQARQAVNENNVHKKYRHKVNLSQTIARLKDSLVLLFIKGDITKLLTKLMHLCIITVEPIRLSRSYPRNRSVKRNIPTLIYRPGR